MKANKSLQIWAKTSALISLALGVCLFLSRRMPQLSGGLNSSACRYFRGALSRLSGALPVFLPELFLILLPVFAFLIFRMAMKLSLRELASIVLLISTLIFST